MKFIVKFTGEAILEADDRDDLAANIVLAEQKGALLYMFAAANARVETLDTGPFPANPTEEI